MSGAQLPDDRAQHGVRQVVGTHDAEALDIAERDGDRRPGSRRMAARAVLDPGHPGRGLADPQTHDQAVVADPEARHPVLDGREDRLWVGVETVETQPLDGQRSGELVPRLA